MNGLMDLHKEFDPESPRFVHHYPDGRGGAVFVYNIGGKFHNVHVPPHPDAVPGDTDPVTAYDHSRATASNGMNISEIGKRLGTYNRRIEDAHNGRRFAPLDQEGNPILDPDQIRQFGPSGAHFDEREHKHHNDMYYALKHHDDQFGVKPSGDVIMPRHQQEHVGKLNGAINDVLHTVRENNKHLKIPQVARINTHLMQTLTDRITEIIRKETGNNQLRYDFGTGKIVHGQKSNPSEADFRKLVDIGLFDDGADHIRQLIPAYSKPLSEDRIAKINKKIGVDAGVPVAVPHNHPEAAQKADWYHRDIEKAKVNFMSPINSRIGRIHAMAKQHYMTNHGLDEQSAHAEAAKYADGIRSQMHGYISKAVPNSHFFADDRPDAPLSHYWHIPSQSNTHDTLANLHPRRVKASVALDNHIADMNQAAAQSIPMQNIQSSSQQTPGGQSQ